MNFYELQLLDDEKKHYWTEIEDRILSLTEQHRNNQALRGEIINWKIPPIVAKIYEKRKDWYNAVEYYKMANLSAENKGSLAVTIPKGR